jgi:hypothetical protein
MVTLTKEDITKIEQMKSPVSKMYTAEQLTYLREKGIAKTYAEAGAILQGLGYLSASQAVRGEQPKSVSKEGNVIIEFSGKTSPIAPRGSIVTMRPEQTGTTQVQQTTQQTQLDLTKVQGVVTSGSVPENLDLTKVPGIVTKGGEVPLSQDVAIKEALSKLPESYKQALTIGVLASPAGWQFLQSKIEQQLGMQPAVEPEKIIFEKWVEVSRLAETKDVVQEIKGHLEAGVKSAASPLLAPVVGAAAGIVATAYPVAGAAMGLASAGFIVKEGEKIKQEIQQKEYGALAVRALSLAEYGLGALAGASWAQQKMVEIKTSEMQKALEQQAKDMKIIEVQNNQQFKSISQIKTAESGKFVQIPSLEKGSELVYVPEKHGVTLEGVIRAVGETGQSREKLFISRGTYTSEFLIKEKGKNILAEIRLEDFYSATKEIGKISEAKLYASISRPYLTTTEMDWSSQALEAARKVGTFEIGGKKVDVYKSLGMADQNVVVRGILLREVQQQGFSPAFSPAKTQAQLSDLQQAQVEILSKQIASQALENMIKGISVDIKAQPAQTLASVSGSVNVPQTELKTENKEVQSITLKEAEKLKPETLKQSTQILEKVETQIKPTYVMPGVKTGEKEIEREKRDITNVIKTTTSEITTQTPEQRQIEIITTITQTVKPPRPEPPEIKPPATPPEMFRFAWHKPAVSISTRGMNKQFKAIEKYKPSLYSLEKGLKLGKEMRKVEREIKKAIWRPKI